MQIIEIERFLFSEVDGDGHWAWSLLVAGALAQGFVDGQLGNYLPNSPTISCFIRRGNLQLYSKMIQAIIQLVLFPFIAS